MSPVFLAESLAILRSRPGATPDDCLLDFIHCARVPREQRDAQPRPVDVTIPADEVDLGGVFNQDIANLERAQRGLHQPAFTHLSLSHEERRITTMHRNLERYLGIPSEITGGEPSQAAGTSVES